MKRRPFFSFLAAIVLVLLSASAVGAVWLTAKSPLRLAQGRVVESPDAAIFVSRQAPLMLSLQVNPDRLKTFNLAKTPLTERGQIQAQFDRWQRDLLGDVRLSYADDIAPWAGDEITIALMNADVDRNETNGRQPGYLLAVKIADPAQATASIQRFWRQQSIGRTELTSEPYAGVKLVYTKSPDQAAASVTTAIVSDQFVLFANYPKVLREALNNIQVPELSLGEDEAYQRAVNQLPDRRIGIAFLNVPQFASLLRSETQEGDRPKAQSLIAALQLAPAGILADTTLLVSEEQPIDRHQPALTKPVAALKSIPAVSSLVAAGTDLDAFWQQVIQGSEQGLLLNTQLQAFVQTLQTQWGIDIATDLFPWMRGEFALGLVPRSDRPQPDWIFVTERSTATDAEVAHLNAIADERGMSNGSFKLGEQEIFAWTKLMPIAAANRSAMHPLSLEATVQGLRTRLGNYEIFATSIEAMSQALNAVQNSILDQPNFQQAIELLPPQNNGYVYADWSTLKNQLNSLQPIERLEQTLKPFFADLQAIILTSDSSDGTRYHAKALMRFREEA
ncbi:MAG TPA: DUF3352 domain-containing protein [Trichocoleus sp.]|jgi:hypothetical protein